MGIDLTRMAPSGTVRFTVEETEHGTTRAIFDHLGRSGRRVSAESPDRDAAIEAAGALAAKARLIGSFDFSLPRRWWQVWQRRAK